MEVFFRPLFHRETEKVYNLNKAFQLQRPVRKKDEEDSAEILDFDEDLWQEELEKKRREKLKKYKKSLGCILDFASRTGEISLQEIGEQIGEEERRSLIPDVDIFKEIMVELIRNREIDIRTLRKERSEYIQDRPGEFQLNEMLLQLVEEHPENRQIVRVETYRTMEGNVVVFDGIEGKNGERKSIRCSNVLIRVVWEE